MMVATNLQLMMTTIILTGVIFLAHATVSITSNSGEAAVCPGQELVLTCIAENTIILRWRVFSSLHSSSFIEKAFTRRSSPGAQGIEGVFVFTLVSNTNNHFESLLMIVATWSLHKTVIECHSASSAITSFIIKIESAPQSPTNISSMVEEHLSISSSVVITWNHDLQVDYYHYELIDELNESVMTLGNTSNTSTIIEDVPYNHDILFTLFAINCVGRSSPITQHINIVGCLDIKSSLVQMNSNFSQAPGTNLSLSCVYNSSMQINITCQDDGRWEPNPHSFSALCDINDIELLNEMTENLLIPNVTNGTVADGFAQSSYVYIHRYIIISVSASLFLVVTGAGMLVMIVICNYQVKKKRREAVCSNLERQYETVDEPIYEMVLNVNPNIEVGSDCNTKYNEAYQKTGTSLH